MVLFILYYYYIFFLFLLFILYLENVGTFDLICKDPLPAGKIVIVDRGVGGDRLLNDANAEREMNSQTI